MGLLVQSAPCSLFITCGSLVVECSVLACCNTQILKRRCDTGLKSSYVESSISSGTQLTQAVLLGCFARTWIGVLRSLAPEILSRQTSEELRKHAPHQEAPKPKRDPKPLNLNRRPSVGLRKPIAELRKVAKGSSKQKKVQKQKKTKEAKPCNSFAGAAALPLLLGRVIHAQSGPHRLLLQQTTEGYFQRSPGFTAASQVYTESEGLGWGVGEKGFWNYCYSPFCSL